ncbi:tryptophan synthase subunit alpha [Melghirimyces algeriensis]|uniref:Tryptophan synthase alpha chain n=1 Tax=Melghirimyces algeriensis TaxID=910412 RepID=A0A521B6R6_9BACL|nr:tryptophan synthase subunit alpha [Melghirimyces algeriensis]SMO42807.1 tryptophan synthase, alpha chain [Melghirimyces algeriensis]
MRMKEVFQQKDRKPLIPFITVGDPDMSTTLDLIRLLDDEKVTGIELGVPYSDPLADGPVIQSASARALAHGVTLPQVLELADKAREIGVTTPLILFSYYNPILQYGPKSLVSQARKAGIDGFIIPDLPWEEGREMSAYASKQGVDLIPLVAPTSRERVRQIVSDAQGFVYCVSSRGTTGVRHAFEQEVDVFLDTVRKWSPVPTAVGFGISHSDHVQRFLQHADAVVVGSALVRKIEETGEKLTNPDRRNEALDEIRQFIRSLMNTVRTVNS